MALLPCPSPPLYSFKLRQANFHPMPFAGKPPVVVRRLTKYHCSAICQYSSHGDSSTSESPEKPPTPTWDNRFIESLDECHKKSEGFNKIRIEELKEEVKNMFIYTNDPLQKIKLVDVIERLGLAYHFDKEIHSTLQQAYDGNEDFGDNLEAIALRFLLLRQHGYNVSCDVLEKFIGKEGNFKQSLRNDVRGLLSLYEASHFSIYGEDILDNSLTFTSRELKSMVNHLDPTLSRRVQRSLGLPPQRGLPRLEARHFISIYEDDESRNDILLELAKMNFNQLQSLHQSEIKEVYRWWKDLDLEEKLPYARDRVVDCYLWAMEINFLPEFSKGRIALAKLINLIVLVDDTYDTHGTFEEIQLFTDAIKRWDSQVVDELPEYLRPHYLAFYNLVNDTEYMSMKHRENKAIYYVKKALQDYCKASIEEARWFKDGYTPSLNEYMSVSLITSAGCIAFLVAALGMGDMVDRQGLEYIVGDSKLSRLANTITRLHDDIATSKDEEKREIATSIYCHMKEYGVSREEACMHIKNLLIQAWKDLNQELLNPIPLPKSLVNGIVNYVKVGTMFYLDGNDSFGNSQCCTRTNMHSMLFEPIPM